MDFRNKYRIVPRDDTAYLYAWYVQCKRWWLPLWLTCELARDEEHARKLAAVHAGEGTKYLGRLP